MFLFVFSCKCSMQPSLLGCLFQLLGISDCVGLKKVSVEHAVSHLAWVSHLFYLLLLGTALFTDLNFLVLEPWSISFITATLMTKHHQTSLASDLCPSQQKFSDETGTAAGFLLRLFWKSIEVKIASMTHHFEAIRTAKLSWMVDDPFRWGV